MKSIHSILTLAALLAAPALTQATVTVVVDDDSSNDAPYSNGSGGNFTGPTAFLDATNAINGDDSGETQFIINIVDTDGQPDVYTGNENIRKTTTIQQIANGKGTDTPVTLKGKDEAGPGASIVVWANDCTIKGLSPDKPMKVQTAGTSNPVTATGIAGTANNTTWENLDYVHPGGDGFCHNDFPADPTLTETFNHCIFRFANGAQTTTKVTFNDCKFMNGGFKHIQQNGDLVANRCDFGYPSAAGLNLTGAVTSTYNDCSFKTSDAAYGPRLLNTFPNEIKSGAVITFNRPTFTGYCGDILFSCESAGVTINVVGTPQNKVDFDAPKPVLIARIMKGTINLVDCKGTVHPAAGGIDHAEATSPDNGKTWNPLPLTGDVNIIMNRCIWGNGACDLSTGDATSPYKVNVTATNTIWYGTTPTSGFIVENGGHTGGGEISLTHCTMAGNTGNAFIFGTPETKLYLEGCIIYSNKVTKSHALSSIAYNARTPHIPCITFVYDNDDSDKNDGSGQEFQGNPFNPATPWTPTHEGDLVVWPGFNIANDKGVIPANSSACGAATGSTMTEDVNGGVRPQPVGSAPDIGAVEVLQVPVELSSFSAE